MTISIDHERLLTFAEAAKLLPRRRAGRKPHASTLYRWASRGIRGVTLETIQIGGTTCTSREALQRFFDRLGRIRNEPSRKDLNGIKSAERFLQQERF